MGKLSSIASFLVIICSLYHCSGRDNIPVGHLLPLGFHRSPEGRVTSVTHTLTPEAFFNEYVALSKPVLLKGAAKLSAGFHRWSDDYLRRRFGSATVRVDYGKKENRARPADDMALEEFLSIYNGSDRYLVDTLPEEMWEEFALPNCLLCGGYTSRLQDAVLWFSSGGTKSFLHIDTVDNINCMISGHKDWFIVDLEHSKGIDMDHGEGDYSSVNVDQVDMFKYPSLLNLPWWSARMDAGDCLFIPYGLAHQVTSHSRNIAVNIWWTPLRRFNSTECQEGVFDEPEARLSNFKFTPGEQLRFLAIQALENLGGSVSFDVIHPLIVAEHTGEKLITLESFSMLDSDGDGYLTTDDLNSLPAEVVDEAFGRTSPGEVNVRGQHHRKDATVSALLQAVSEQPPFVEEFLLREHKTADDIHDFLVQHSAKLVDPVRRFLEERLSKAGLDRVRNTEEKHQEL